MHEEWLESLQLARAHGVHWDKPPDAKTMCEYVEGPFEPGSNVIWSVHCRGCMLAAEAFALNMGLLTKKIPGEDAAGLLRTVGAAQSFAAQYGWGSEPNVDGKSY